MGARQREEEAPDARAGVKSRVSGVPRRRRHLEAACLDLSITIFFPRLACPSYFCSGSNPRPRGTPEPHNEPDPENQLFNQDPRTNPRFLCYNRYRDLREHPLHCCGQYQRIVSLRGYNRSYSASRRCRSNRSFSRAVGLSAALAAVRVVPVGPLGLRAGDSTESCCIIIASLYPTSRASCNCQLKRHSIGRHTLQEISTR
ncbi:hypothetical protein L227DRAFT_114155 [Lentinus tigrinus ALCF2SS1-6]|uniref:Uncharacterized protein n=1 Tax=Lentinus tigrinus ALCF2SS1-6 TaxID=1328759 RepID=A0A5C2S9R3_9APHY|nr:hypothetical protein L227DRAFT_114155 [Lentinus tigrinus ALCF2SS1-6]